MYLAAAARTELPFRRWAALQRLYKMLPAPRAEAFIPVLVPEKGVEVVSRIAPEEKIFPVLYVLVNELLELAAVNRRHIVNVIHIPPVRLLRAGS